MAEVKFIDPQGQEITRDIQSAEQVSGFEKSGFKTVSNPFTQPSTEVSSISTKDAVSQINSQKGYLDSTYPPYGTSQTGLQQFANENPEGFDSYADKNGYGTSPAPEGKAYFTNQAGQEAEYTQDQLNDPNTQQYLKDNGYVMVKSEGVNVGSDFSTSKTQTGLNEASTQVENLTKDFLNYNVDQDPDFQAQAKTIRAEFDRLKRQMEKTNYSRAQGLSTLGMRSGTTQYAGAIQSGIEGEELNQANQRLADIAQEEAATISAARSAFKNNKFTEFNNKVTALKDIRDQKQKELESYTTAIANYTKKLQEEEQASIEQQKFEFEVYKFEEEMKLKKGEKQKPLVVSPGSSLYDPDTMDYLGTAPKIEDPENAQIVKGDNGVIYSFNPNTNVLTALTDTGLETGENSQTVIDWANAISKGEAKLSDITGENATELKSQVLSTMAKLPPKQEDVVKTQAKIDGLQALLDDPGMRKAVGANEASRTNYNPFDWNDKSQKNAFIGKIEQLLSEKTLKALQDAKANGATFGALSEGELRILESAASSIGTWKRYTTTKDGDKIVSHYEVGEGEFKKEINRIKSEYENLLKETAGQDVTPTGKVQEFYNKNPDKRQQIDNLQSTINPDTGRNFTDDEIIKYYGPSLGISFNSVGGDTKIASRVAKIPDGADGGQCGRFVNKLTGLGVADSYKSKMAKMDPSIKKPAPGMVFVMPSNGAYSEYGHVGIILAVNNGIATVKDSNWKGNEKVLTHQIPVSRMTGFRRVNLS